MQCTIHLLLLTAALSAGDDDLRVLPHDDGAPAADRLVETDLKRPCWAALDRRRVAYEELKTPEDCLAYQEQMRQFFRRQIGDLPERSPLEARVVGKLEGDGFRVEQVGEISRDGYRIDKLILTSVGRPPLPALAFVPPDPRTDACLYVHGEGKHADAASGGPIERLVRQGQIVLAVDVRACGETERRDNRRIRWTTGMFGPSYHEFMLAYLLGQSFVGLRVEDILIAARFLSYYDTDGRRSVHIVGIGQTAIPALHAAALEPELVASLCLRKMTPSWQGVVHARETQDQLINVVHGALGVYDLPDLERMYGADRITVEQPLDVLGQPLE